MILNILELLGVPILQNMYTLAQWEHGNVYGNVYVNAIGTWERGRGLVWEHGSVYDFPMSSPLTSQSPKITPKSHSV